MISISISTSTIDIIISTFYFSTKNFKCTCNMHSIIVNCKFCCGKLYYVVVVSTPSSSSSSNSTQAIVIVIVRIVIVV